jgi:hypothetical protein
MILWGVVYIMANTADYFLTMSGRELHLNELNPIIDGLPMLEFAIYKAIVTTLALVLIYALHRISSGRWVKYVLPGVSIGMPLVVVSNSFFLWSAI